MTDRYPKTALVTGAATRIGRTIALDMADKGWTVAVHYRNSEKEALAVVDEIRSAGGTAAPARANLSVESETAALLPLVHRMLGPVGCLINNASEFERDEISSMTRSSWDAHLETNLRAPALLIQQMADSLPEGQQGAVFNILDQRVWNLTPHFVSYTVSKSALWTLTQSLALALAPRIRVNAIGPGPVLPSKRQTQADFDKQVAGLPLKQGTTPEEIAAAIQFLLSSPSVTGQMLAMDGGQHLGWAQPRVEDGTVE